MSTLAIVQARMGSMRLPGKVLMTAGGRPLIAILLYRLASATEVDDIVVAIPDSAENDVLEAVVASLGFRVTRGSENDVLSRYYSAAIETTPSTIVRITGDCPLVDPALVDAVIREFHRCEVDYVSNTIPARYPDGLDVEVFSFRALELTNSLAVSKHDREHVTPFIKESSDFTRKNFGLIADHSNLRWTVDDAADLDVVRSIIDHFAPTLNFAWDDALTFVLSGGIPQEITSMQDERDKGASMSASQKLWRRAQRVIPGGNMLLSKRPEMYAPAAWPAYFESTTGCTVTDIDGNRFIDMSLMGIGTNTLGYSHPTVDAAVMRTISRGNMSTLNCPEEVLLAERLVAMHPWADMAKFARTGGEANAIAIRIARAASGRDGVAICGYHGWHDWYLAANLETADTLSGHLLPGLDPLGVPRNLAGTVHAFRHGDLAALEQILQMHDIGVIKMEVARNTPPDATYLRAVRALADTYSAVLIFDECTSGFRQTFGGLHLQFGVSPDMATFGKALGNGYAITAVIGTEAVMDAAQSTFISSTFWTERIGPTAALATLDVMQETRSWELITATGEHLVESWHALARECGLKLETMGLPALATFSFGGSQALEFKTLMAQEMLKVGYLAGPGAYACIAHTEDVLAAYLEALRPVFQLIHDCQNGLDVHSLLEGPICHTTFTRLN